MNRGMADAPENGNGKQGLIKWIEGSRFDKSRGQ